ncbi:MULTISPECIES: DciA family protein [Thermodesulfobacterium]|jgi:hypothetical protein|uniref:DUF721 domain-containing protein n=2 Tax=Thermodesulfobacterium commune TaxID=1741 RepID=A0A075WR10_9BACT|nr:MULTISPECIES: DciA family protein [Thermodesulfobacterium]KUJ97493.1 MAG: Uncharacterized protein XD42_0858 [Thermodesulfobacterium sp. 37_54]KUK19242.1 MAG: Uncharacterized protein XD55_0702 [Thermodesulfobacterium commune]AIH03390.1 hypothetical protein HL41_00260 [Thermodesulfobacterium commune DSM 2178]KUK38592.1 MAG: Uncharacterized protein XD67_0093 [Thermodesulfobacterium commune]MBZ4681157.1 hypothetical protein [Thermodesulfobacterium sp.]
MESFEHLLQILPIPYKTKKAIRALKLAKSLWPKLLDRELALCSNPIRYEEGTLVVETSDYYHLQQLQLKGREIIEALEKVAPEKEKPLFVDLKIVINPLIFERLTKNKQLVNSKEGVLRVNPEDVKELEKTLQNLKDPELAKLFKGLLKTYFKAKKIQKI